MKLSEAQIGRLVNVWQIRLGLDQWRLKLTFTQAGEDDENECFAKALPSKHYDEASIVFYIDVLAKKTKREIEETVVHELLHLAHRDVESIVDLLDGQVANAVEEALTESFRHSVEQFIERTARVLVGLAPVTKEAS